MIPNNLKYTKEHEWISIEKNIATIGITKHAIEELGEIVFIEIQDPNNIKEQNDEFGTIESVKTVSSLYLPISGTYIESNKVIIKNPEIINQSPYKNGWLIKIEIKNPEELKNLMNNKEYENYLKTD